jgi:sodium/pantothenate symporter
VSPGAQALAVSFFVMWAIAGTGRPSTLVRLRAFRDSRTLRAAML